MRNYLTLQLIIKQDDVTWIKHECAERHHELKYGSGYYEAHGRAQSGYDVIILTLIDFHFRPP